MKGSIIWAATFALLVVIIHAIWKMEFVFTADILVIIQVNMKHIKQIRTI